MEREFLANRVQRLSNGEGTPLIRRIHFTMTSNNVEHGSRVVILEPITKKPFNLLVEGLFSGFCADWANPSSHLFKHVSVEHQTGCGNTALVIVVKPPRSK